MRILQELGFQPPLMSSPSKNPRKLPWEWGVAAHASFRLACPATKTRYTTNKRLHEGHVASGA